MVDNHTYTRARRWPRALADIRVNFRIISDPAKSPENSKDSPIQRAWARSRDISEGGLAIYSVLDLAVGERLELDFELPESGGTVNVRGVIRNHSGFRYGIEFLLLSRADRLRIAEFVEARRCAAQN